MNGGKPITPERFLFVIWEKARKQEDRLLQAISSRFKVVRKFEVVWPHRYFTANLSAFYGWKNWFCWWNKARKCGRGPFLAIEVEDPSPEWVRGADTSGHDLVLNANVRDAKRELRTIDGHANRVHASLTKEEAAHEFAALADIGEDGIIPFREMDYGDAPNARHSLPKRLRRKWDAVMADEGSRIGLTGCKPFLENKIANDIFYEGWFNGRPCIVKCSSRAPDSIANEYEMLKRVHAEAPEVFPEPFALWTSRDGRMAFVAMEKVGGGTPADPASDILRIAEALRTAGIVHRDVSTENLICGTDGHLKLIDFQFAIDRNNYRESAFMRRNPKYLYVHFGAESLGLGRWNDILGLGLAECLDRFAPDCIEPRKKLLAMADEMTFAAPVGANAKFRIRLYHASLCVQSLLSNKWSLKWRLYKVRKLRGIGDGGSFPAFNSVSRTLLCTKECPNQNIGVVEEKKEGAWSRV